jgi:group I intron endonuclease
MYYVYKITNSINDKVYVGRTIRSIEQRYKEHLQSLENGDTRHLYSAMRKYGANNFKIELIEECSTLDEMIEKEAYYCELLEAYTKGYNMTTAGEINPMECEKAKASHKRKMQSEEVKSKISETMKRIRANSPKTISIHKGKIGKRISSEELDYYINNGWELGSNLKGKIRIYNKTTFNETSVWQEELEHYLEIGWALGGKPNRISPDHAAKLAASHKGMFDENFKKEQSIRLKEFYKNNPNWKTKSKRAVKIEHPNTGESIEFNSYLELCRGIDLPESIARAGTVGKWVKVGHIKRKSSKYNNWKIYNID